MPDRGWFLTVVDPDAGKTLPVDFYGLDADHVDYDVGYFPYQHEDPLALIDEVMQDKKSDFTKDEYTVVARCTFELERAGIIETEEVYDEELLEQIQRNAKVV